MRALMLTPDEGYLDRRIAQEAASLARHGWQVDIFPTADPALRFEMNLSAGVRLVDSPLPARRDGAFKRAARSIKRAVSRGVPPAGRFIERTLYQRRDRAAEMAAANIAHLASMDPYELMFAHDVPVFPLAASLKALWRCPLICDLHEVFPEQDEHFTTTTARQYWRSVESVGLTVSDGIICVNDAVAEYAFRTHGPGCMVVVVHNSVPFVERDELRGPTLHEYYAISDDVRIMLFAGSLRPHNNLETMIRGFGRARLDGWVLALLGDGPLERSLAGLVRREGLRDQVFLGRRAPQEDLVAVASSADIGLLPYQGIGFNHLIATPNKLFEYIQARLPIATSRLPMIERIVSSKGNGDFVDYSTPDTAAADLRRFVSGALGRITPDDLDSAAREFSWENEETALLRVVESAMSRSAPQSRELSASDGSHPPDRETSVARARG